MKREGWFLILGKWNGAQVRVHFLAPLFALFMPGHEPSIGTVTGLLLVILVHELGHAILINRLGARVQRIDLLPYGGECEHSGVSSEFHESIIAWGGVLAQFALMMIAQLLLTTAPPQTVFAADFLWAITLGNLMIALFNLLPIGPLDGARAWRMIVLGPMWLLKKRPAGVSLSNRFKRWRKRKHLRVVETPPSRKDLN